MCYALGNMAVLVQCSPAGYGLGWPGSPGQGFREVVQVAKMYVLSLFLRVACLPGSQVAPAWIRAALHKQELNFTS